MSVDRLFRASMLQKHYFCRWARTTMCVQRQGYEGSEMPSVCRSLPLSLSSAGCFGPFLLFLNFDPSDSWMPWPPGLPLVSTIHLSSLLSGYTLLSTRAMVQDTLNVPKGLVYPLIPNYASSLRHLHLNKGQHPQLVDILFLDLLHDSYFCQSHTSIHLLPSTSALHPIHTSVTTSCHPLPSTQSIPPSPVAAIPTSAQHPIHTSVTSNCHPHLCPASNPYLYHQ